MKIILLSLVLATATLPCATIGAARSAAQNFKCKDGTTVLGYYAREACADHGGRDRTPAQGTTDSSPAK